MVGNFLGCLFVLFILFGLLCNLTGDENKGMQIINNCVTAIVIYSMIIVIFSAKNSEIIKLNIPFWNGIVKYGTLKSYLKASAGGFALDFIQLVTLVLLINWVSIINYKNDYRNKARGICECLHIRFIKTIKYRKGNNSFYIIVYCYFSIYVCNGFAIWWG